MVACDLPNEDWAEETTEIDMQNHTISQKAEYIIGGMDTGSSWEDEENF